MDQSNDDLQSAINGIVNAENGAPAPAPEMAAPEAGMPDLGMPPMPPAPEAGASLDMALPNTEPVAEAAPEMTPEMAAPEITAPEVSAPAPEADLMNQAPASIEEQAAAEAAPEAPVPDMVAPEVAPEAGAEAPEVMPEMAEVAPEVAPAEISAEAPSELSSVRQSMIQDLIPLMDKVSLDADKKFGLYKEVLDSTHDKTMVPAAYEVVKGIADDTARAEALSYLLNESE